MTDMKQRKIIIPKQKQFIFNIPQMQFPYKNYFTYAILNAHI